MLLGTRCVNTLKMTPEEIDVCFKAVEEVARDAGKMIREAFQLEKRIALKSSAADLVTETDEKVEKLIIGTLREKFPTHSFIGEESVAAGEKCILTDNPTWIIDPIDGTTNFVHRFPFVCVSIALSVNQKTEIGLVYNPILEEMYTALTGRGAFCNGVRLQCSSKTDLGQSLICSEFGSDRNPDKLDSKFRSMRNIIEKSHGIRSCGSAAVNMCHVANGSTEAYFEYGMHVWDIAAGDLIVREAGGVVLDAKGGPLDLMARQVLCAGTNELAQQIAKLVERIEFERD